MPKRTAWPVWPVGAAAMVPLADARRAPCRHDPVRRQLCPIAMLRHPLLRPLPLIIVALGFLLLAFTDPSAAAETSRRLKIDVEFKRDGTVQQGAEQGRGKLVQQ